MTAERSTKNVYQIHGSLHSGVFYFDKGQVHIRGFLCTATENENNTTNAVAENRASGDG
jgi:hypothetical protein